jgi:ArsR family transcriptional regulator
MIDMKSLPVEAIQEDTERENRLLVALSVPTRRRMLSLLSEADGAMCVGELVAHFDLEQATISHHLAVLAAINLVYRGRRARRGVGGQYAYYYVNHDVLREAQNVIASIATRRSYASH